MRDLFDLTGKVAVVAGGAGGIGRALALGMAEYGADVVVADRQLEHFEETAEKIRALSRRVLAVTVDITQVQPVADMVKKTLEMFSHIDILVNAAGISIRKPAEGYPVDEWQQVMDVNIRGTFLTCRAVGQVMIKQGGGKIINISSVRGRYGAPQGAVAYCPSKGAVDALTRTLACEWAKYNVLVNAIAPGLVETGLTRPLLENPEDARRRRADIPIGRWAMPEDMLGPVLFLVSKASDYVTGQIMYVDGGVTTSV